MNFQALGPMVKLPEGVTLRDWFAGQALTGIRLTVQDPIRTDDPNLHRIAAMVATGAYAIADAMMAERERREHEECAHAAPAEPPF